jgi:hypothetical protein
MLTSLLHKGRTNNPFHIPSSALSLYHQAQEAFNLPTPPATCSRLGPISSWELSQQVPSSPRSSHQFPSSVLPSPQWSVSQGPSQKS